MKDEKAKAMLISVKIRPQIELLTNEEAGELFKSLLVYADEGKPISSENRVLTVVFAGMRTQIDVAAEKYANKCERNKAIAIEREQKKRESTNVHERTRTCTNKENTSVPNGSSLDFLNSFLLYFNAQLVAKKSLIKQIQHINGNTRRAAVLARARENGEEALNIVANKAAESDFLNGKNDRGWVATFDWLMKPNNFVKVLEGNYDNTSANKGVKKNEKDIDDLWQ